MLLTSGLRISEALGLEWADLDPAAGVLHVRYQLVMEKGAEPRRVGPHHSRFSG
jgi:integrase